MGICGCLFERGSMMKPHIDETEFGSITIAGEVYEHDVLIRLDGSIAKRKKKLSKARYGASHKLSREEAKYVYEKGGKQLIVGTGQTGLLELSEEAAQYFSKKDCSVELLPTPKAIEKWNSAKGATIGLFHVTC